MKMNNSLFFIMLSLLAGAMIPFQSAMNAQLGKSLQSPYFSALVVFIVAVIGLALYIFASGCSSPSVAQFAAAPKWSYLGGLFGGTYILLIVICAPKLGIGNVTVMILLGQIIAALIIDQFGMLNSVKHAVNWQRLIGVALLLTGVYLVKKY